MDNSFAIWYEKKDTQISVSPVELHFNLWQFSSQKKNHIDCLDIGIKTDKISNLSSINLFIPFVLNNEDVRDLGEVITKDVELLDAIFNEYCTVGSKRAKLVDVTFKSPGINSSNISFKVYVMQSDNLSVQPIKEGTIIKINIENINHDDSVPIYFRLRIDFSSQDIFGKVIHQYSPKDSCLQSSTEKKQFVDFRLNEKRNLPEKIEEKCIGKFFDISQVHFFLMREFADELNMSDPDHSKYRVLEKDIWSNYFSEKPKLKLDYMLAYHWKISHFPNNSFTLSTKFSFKESSLKKVILFVLLTLCIGACGGVGGNYLTNKLFGGSENIPEKIEQKSIDPSVETEKLEKESVKEDN